MRGISERRVGLVTFDLRKEGLDKNDDTSRSPYCGSKIFRANRTS
jgi:DNA-directed RNA polymerase subunit RPC12/RpoP